MSVSATQEDYLRTIYLLTLEDDAASVTNIAKRLRLSKSTVSERLRDLSEANLITREHYGKVTLTSEGIMVGKNITHKHRLIEVFLHDRLGMSASEIHAEADILEHTLSDNVIRRLGNYLGNPTRDPHDSAIPPLD